MNGQFIRNVVSNSVKIYWIILDINCRVSEILYIEFDFGVDVE